VLAGLIRVRVEQLLAQVDLIGKLRLAPLAQNPHRPANRSQRLHHPLEEGGVELFGSQVALGKLGNFADQAADLLLGLFNGFGADLG
jgi:hypothetical protein